jgi:hypothetical protein
MKYYQAVRMGKEVQMLRERAEVLLYAALPILYNKLIVTITLRVKLKLRSEEMWRQHVTLGPLSFWTFIIV